MNNLFSKRSFKYGAASTAFTVIFLAAIILVNIIFAVLGDKFNLRLDLTKEGLYEISGETKDFLRELEKEVTLTIMVPEVQFDQRTLELLKKYNASSNKIELKSIDLNVNPAYAQKYNTNLNYSSIVVECGSKYKVLNTSDFYQYNTSTGEIIANRAEQKITSAIQNVTSDTTSKMLFTKGHDEIETQVFRQMAEENNYVVEEISLLTDNIDEDVKMIIIVNPKRDFTLEEIDKIDRYIDRGGVGLTVFVSPENTGLTNLESYIAEWGIEIQSDLVLDSRAFYNQPYAIIPQTVEGDYTSGIGSNEFIITPMTKSLNILFEEKGLYYTDEILKTYDSAYSKKVNDLNEINDQNKAEGDLTGPFVIAASSQKMITGSSTNQNSRLVVFGSSYMISDSMLSTTSFANTELTVNLFNSVKNDDGMIYVSPKYYKNEYLKITNIEGITFGFIFVIAIPVGLLISAFVVFLRRKNR